MNNTNRATAEHWLNKGVQMEAEGKSTSLVNKCLDKAVEYENKAIAEERGEAPGQSRGVALAA